MIRNRIAAAFAAGTVLLGTGTVMPVFSTQAFDGENQHISDFSLADITMEDAYCTNAFAKEIEYLLSFDVNRLLCGFRENAKMNTMGAKRYKGWEDTLIAGHTVGHYLTALAQAYLHPELTDTQKKKISDMLDGLLSGMAECQKIPRASPVFSGQVR